MSELCRISTYADSSANAAWLNTSPKDQEEKEKIQNLAPTSLLQPPKRHLYWPRALGNSSNITETAKSTNTFIVDGPTIFA